MISDKPLTPINNIPDSPITFTINNIKVWTKSVLNECGVRRWNVKYDDNDKYLGLTDFENKSIIFSKYWVTYFLEKNNQEEIKRLILHEIAHVLTIMQDPFTTRLHGKLWKGYCKLLGIPNEKAKYYLD